MSNPVCFIRIFAVEMHSNGFCRPDGRLVGVFAVRVQRRIICIPECPVPDSLRCLFGVTPVLAVVADMIADLRQHISVDILKRQSAVTNHFSGFFQTDGPQAKPVYTVTIYISFDPGSDTRLVEGIRIMPHNFSICQHPIQRIISFLSISRRNNLSVSKIMFIPAPSKNLPLTVIVLQNWNLIFSVRLFGSVPKYRTRSPATADFQQNRPPALRYRSRCIFVPHSGTTPSTPPYSASAGNPAWGLLL